MAPKRKAKHYFLTWPQNDTPKEEVLAALTTKEAGLKWCVVATEDHKDGHKHLHALLVYEDLHTFTTNHWNYAAGDKHGDVQAARNLGNVLTYIIKDGNYVEFGIDVAEFLKSKKKKTSTRHALMVDEIRQILDSDEKATMSTILDRLDEAHGDVLLRTLRSVQEYVHYSLSKRQRTNKPVPSILHLNFEFQIPIGKERQFKQTQYWIHGPPNVGKTSIIRKLLETHRGFVLPTNNDFKDYADGQYDFAFIDEFKGQLTLQFLNQWLDGQHLFLNTKGGSVLKKENITTFIVSNYAPGEVFQRNQDKLDALLSRLTVISLTEFPTLTLVNDGPGDGTQPVDDSEPTSIEDPASSEAASSLLSLSSSQTQ